MFVGFNIEQEKNIDPTLKVIRTQFGNFHLQDALDTDTMQSPAIVKHRFFMKKTDVVSTNNFFLQTISNSLTPSGGNGISDRDYMLLFHRVCVNDSNFTDRA